MAGRNALIIHERRGTWARQLRPRASAWGARLVETRSAADLESAIGGELHPIVLVDLGDRPAPGLIALGLAKDAAPTALCLVLDPGKRDGVAPLAREVGATLVLSGQVAPPVVVGLLSRWRAIAERRTATEGWIGEEPDEADPLARLLAPDA